MTLLALAIAPGLAICLYIFHRDVYNREPKLNLILSFILGGLTIIPAALIEVYFMERLENTIAGKAVLAFAVVAFIEELGKFVVLRYYAYTRKTFDEPLDGIVYAVMISMGFATVENIMYADQYGLGVVFARMFLSVPGHAAFAVLMGYYVGKAKFVTSNKSWYLLLGLFWAVFFHGTYDFFLFLQETDYIKENVSEALLLLGSITTFIIALRLSWKHIRVHRLLSQQTYRPTESLSIRKAYEHDIPLIRDLTNKVWPQTYATILAQEQIDYMLDLMYSETSLRKQMEEKHEFILVSNGKEPVGFASFSMTEPGVYKLHKIYVLPSEQGKGTGKFVISQIEIAMKNKGATALQLNVNRNNKAKDFYEKLGFTVIREVDIDIGKGYFMNDYVMEKRF